MTKANKIKKIKVMTDSELTKMMAKMHKTEGKRVRSIINNKNTNIDTTTDIGKVNMTTVYKRELRKIQAVPHRNLDLEKSLKDKIESLR